MVRFDWPWIIVVIRILRITSFLHQLYIGLLKGYDSFHIHYSQKRLCWQFVPPFTKIILACSYFQKIARFIRENSSVRLNKYLRKKIKYCLRECFAVSATNAFNFTNPDCRANVCFPLTWCSCSGQSWWSWFSRWTRGSSGTHGAISAIPSYITKLKATGYFPRALKQQNTSQHLDRSKIG